MTCTNAYDTITQSAGTPLANHYDYADSGHTVTSYCRTTEGTWIAWINVISGESTASTDQTQRVSDKATWPSDIASSNAIGVGYFPDDGSGPVVYELGIDSCYTWNSASFYSDRDPCSLWPFTGDKYSDNSKSILTSWFSGLLDVQVRTDGTNVWVVALAREAVKYPYLENAPTEIDRCGNKHPTFQQYWDGGHSDPFVHDTDSGTRWWYYLEGTPIGGDMPFGAYDDPGPDNSFRWQPARVTVFAGDIGGFTRVDTVEAKFRNDGSGSGLIGPIECAASPAEPGVLHVLWAEAGDFGVQTFDQQRGQRINYSRWSSSAKTLDTDLLYTSESGSGTISDANWVWTGEYILRNDHGSPVAIVWPWIADGGPQGPDTAAEFWDLSGGAIDVLQTLDATLVPTAAETGLGSVAQQGVLWNQAAIGAVAGTVAPGPRRSQYVSSLYTDSRLGNQDVYLICSQYENGTQRAAGFYRIPCDGSDTFTFLDGVREVMYSIIPDGAFVDSLDQFKFASDFVSDIDDIWMPALEGDTQNGGVLQLDRQCKRGWTLLPSFPVPDPVTGYENGQWVLGSSAPAIVSDGTDDWLYGGGTGPTLTTQSSSPTNIAALKAKICRCCQPCNRTGMHVWEII